MTNVPTGPTGEAVPVELTAADMRGMLRRLHEARQARDTADPMLATVQLVRAERERYNAAADADEDVDGALYHWLDAELASRTPTVGTNDGAIAALRLAADSLENDFGSFQEPLVAAALQFLRTGRA